MAGRRRKLATYFFVLCFEKNGGANLSCTTIYDLF